MKKNPTDPQNKNVKLRKNIRFNPDPATIAQFYENKQKTSELLFIGLVLNESFGGCAILINHDGGLKKDQKICVKVGQLGPMMANVVWAKNLEESIFKIGLKFID